MKPIFSLFWMFSMLCPLFVEAQVEITHDPQTGIPFFDSLGTMSLSNAQVYEEDHFFISATYRDAGRAVASLYIYRGNRNLLEDGIADPIVQQEFEKVIKASAYLYQEKEQFVDFQQVQRDLFAVSMPWDSLLFLHSELTYTIPANAKKLSERVETHIYLTSYKGYFLKIRFSRPVISDDATTAYDFMNRFCKLLIVHRLATDWLSEEDFRSSEETVVKVVEWLRVDPMNPPDALHELALNFAQSWFDQVPYLSVFVNPIPLLPIISDKSCSCASFLDDMYTLGCGLHALTSGEDELANNVAALEYVIAIYTKLEQTSSGECCPGLRQLINRTEGDNLDKLFLER
jgi:hypothetical protein